MVWSLTCPHIDIGEQTHNVKLYLKQWTVKYPYWQWVLPIKKQEHYLLKKMLTFKVSFFHTKQCSNKNNYRVKCEKMLIFVLQIEDEDDNTIPEHSGHPLKAQKMCQAPPSNPYLWICTPSSSFLLLCPCPSPPLLWSPASVLNHQRSQPQDIFHLWPLTVTSIKIQRTDSFFIYSSLSSPYE